MRAPHRKLPSPAFHVAILLGGAAGGAARYSLTLIALAGLWPAYLPVLVANTIGCLLIGRWAAWAQMQSRTRAFPDWAVAGLTGGFCGGFTTFSMLSLEMLDLWTLGQPLFALGVMMSSLVLGVGMVVLGARSVRGRRPVKKE